MRIPGSKGLKLSARWLRSRLLGGALILGYHRITEPVRDSYSMCVTPRHFSEQLEVLCQVGQVISLGELVSGLQERCVPKRAVVLTFDDGYADVLYHAKPMLERYQTPATLFVTTGHLGREFWWDKLERMLLSAEELPGQLSLRIDGGNHKWASGSLGSEATRGTRQHLLRSLHRRLLPLSPLEREKAMAPMWAWSGSVSEDRSQPRALTPDEIMALAAGNLIDVGAHTVTHPVLAALSIPAQRSEIQQSKVLLEEILGRPVTSFAYPNGSSSKETLAIVRHSGFRCACASYNDVVWQRSNPFHLPRFWMPDWDGPTFLRWLGRWLAS